MSLITTEQANQVTKLAVAMFGAAPGGYKEFLDGVHLANGADLVATATAFGNEPAFGAMYNGTAQENADKMIANLSLDKITDTATKDLAKAYITDAVAAGENIATLYGFALNYMANPDAGQDFSEALAVIDNKVAVANSFTAGKGKAVTNLDVLINAIAGVDENTDVDSFVYAELTTDRDEIFGDSGNNTFVAGLSANQDTLQSGDYINGGAGVDTLSVTLANTPYAITPETESVEILSVRSQSNLGQSNGDNEVKGGNTIDAEKMNGTVEFWSANSRADLTIEDVRNDSHETTVGWRQADAGTDKNAVDYSVYFDHDHITSPDGASIGGSLTLTIADLDLFDATVDTANANNGSPFDAGFPYDILNINFAGVEYDLNIDYTNVSDWADLAVQINTELAAKGLDNLQAAVSGTANVIHPVTGNALTVKQVVISKVNTSEAGNFDAAASTWDTTGSVPGDTAYLTRIQDEQAVDKPSLTQVDVVLDHVGRGEKAGILEIGNISNIENNTHAYSKGIEQFNVEVDRDSYFGVLKSTSNGVQNVATSLEVVNVVNIADNSDGKGNLRIDGGIEGGKGLTDVRVFDASKMVGDAYITAELTAEVVAKYMDRKDTQSNPSADNSDPVDYLNVDDQEFSYDFGAGNDTLDLVISSANLEAAGSTSREDFELEINGGGGNDTITTMIGDGTGDGNDAWYTNSTINANLTVNGGAGNDTITTSGAGNFVIDAGAGNDTVYADNTGEGTAYGSALTALATAKAATPPVQATIDAAQALVDSLSGGKAIWVLNAVAGPANKDITDLLSEDRSSATGVNAFVTVTFKGISVEAEIAGSYGKMADQTITDLQINQAIKEAINKDDTLNKLLVAEDGPSGTLVISSLIDGGVAGDLSYEFSNKALTTAQSAVVPALTLFDNTSMLMADGTAPVDYIVSTSTSVPSATDGTNPIDGADSTATSDNIITGGTGNDVIVLGTNANDTNGDLGSNDTIVFSGTNFGDDVVVNFVIDATTDGVLDAGADILDFTAYLGSAATTLATSVTGGGTDSEVVIAAFQNINNDAIIDTGDNFSAAAVKALYTDGATAYNSVYIAYDADNIGSVYHVTDGTGATDLNVSLVGTIDLADTNWSSIVSADNLA